MTPPNLPSNPSSIKTRFAYRFLRTLKRLNNNHQPNSSSSPRSIIRRCRMIKLAADSSMASAVGSRRLWSRAILRKIRYRGRRRFMVLSRRCLGERINRGFEFEETKQLRKLVPGGENMDLKSLFDETAHYIKCLTTQVQVMRNIVELCSSTT